jgi:type I restriction enzyme S subunit
MEPEGIVDFQSANSINDIHDPKDEQCRIVAYLDGLQAKLDALRCLQSETAAELDALMPSILDKAFRGEL